MMKALQKKKRQKGFTLIELIVVIAILGILAAIAIPRFGNVTTGAQTAADQATARTIASAVTMAQANNNTSAVTKAQIEAFLSNVTISVVAAAPSGTNTNGWEVVVDPIAVYHNGTKMSVDN